MADRLLVLAWHAVDRTWEYPCQPGAGSRGFARQLRWLHRVANVVPLDSSLDDLHAGRPLPPRAVALTFDDGYRDNLDLGVPLLERLGLPATFFLVPGILSQEVRPWWEVLGWAFARSSRTVVEWSGMALRTGAEPGRRSRRLVAERLKQLDRADRDRMVAELCELLAPEGTFDSDRLFLDWAGARELVRRGFSVGSHSMYHSILSREEVDRQVEDLAASRQLLERELDVRVRLLAYPNGARGDYDAGTLLAAERAGYTHSLTVRPGLNNSSTPAHEGRRVVLAPDERVWQAAVRRVTGKLVRVTRQRLVETLG
ncbi:MAG TPA: polysaccharide deacetylase family protein [Actinomycetes bacterium]|jgi:peptidoglycan/xylan/chitin deacetylase (PgdA/CDA1 family)|nr:polysaccharide deacetylase family protein [Actinomycetes bacterium]